MAGVLTQPRTLGLVLLLLLFIVFPFLHGWPVTGSFISEFRTRDATMFGVWLLVVISMNLLTGRSGQISLGHAAVVLVGAYTTAILFSEFGVPLALAVLIAGFFTAAVGGIIIGLPASRLEGPYLAIATFALIITLPQILKLSGLDNWTNGALGIRVAEIEAPQPFSNFLDNRQWLYYVSIGTALIMTGLSWNLTKSRIGRAFVALRDNESAATAVGIDVSRYKALAFGISSLYAGIAGGIFFMVRAFVSPESLGLQQSILFLVAVVIGGLGALLGSIFGALFLTFQAEFFTELSDLFAEAQSLRGVIFGGLLIVTIITFPRGLAGFVQGVINRLSGRRSRASENDAAAGDSPLATVFSSLFRR